MPVLAVNPMDHVIAHDLFRIDHIWVTNHMLMATVAAALMIAIFPPLFRKPIDTAPSGTRNFFESILEFMRVEVFRPALKEHTDRFVPFLWTLFFFILFCNLLGQIPFAEIIALISSGKVLDLGGTATGNINITGALAICAVIFIHLNGIAQAAHDLRKGTYGMGHHEEHSAHGQPPHEAAQDLEHMRAKALPADVPQHFVAIGRPAEHYTDDQHAGPADPHGPHAEHGGRKPVAAPLAILMAVPLYLWNFAPHPMRPHGNESKIMWLADAPLWGLLLVLELIGAVIKPFALMIRLFANMIAGHMVMAALVMLILLSPKVIFQVAIGTPVTVLAELIRLLEIFVAFLQAYIFTFLTTLFIASAVAPEH